MYSWVSFDSRRILLNVDAFQLEGKIKETKKDLKKRLNQTRWYNENSFIYILPHCIFAAIDWLLLICVRWYVYKKHVHTYFLENSMQQIY